MAGARRIFDEGDDEPTVENVSMKYEDNPVNMNVDLNALWPITAYQMFANDYGLGFYGKRNADFISSEYFVGSDGY